MCPSWQIGQLRRDTPVSASTRSRESGVVFEPDGSAIGGLVPQEPEIADAVEAAGEYVQQEAPDELGGGERHHFHLRRGAVVFPAKAHLVVREVDEPSVGDGDAMRVAPDVVET
jgi:hypothetical protein